MSTRIADPDPAAEQRADVELVRRLRAQDPSAWPDVVERFSRYVFAITKRAYGLSDHDAEDVFQEVFLRLFERLGGLREDAALRPWIAQVTRRLCIDRLRRDRERPQAEVEPPGADETLRDIEEAMAVRQGLGALTRDCQEVLDRFFCQDQSYQRISAELDIPQGTIASRISRCLTRLRDVLGVTRGPAVST